MCVQELTVVEFLVSYYWARAINVSSGLNSSKRNKNEKSNAEDKQGEFTQFWENNWLGLNQIWVK